MYSTLPHHPSFHQFYRRQTPLTYHTYVLLLCIFIYFHHQLRLNIHFQPEMTAGKYKDTRRSNVSEARRQAENRIMRGGFMFVVSERTWFSRYDWYLPSLPTYLHMISHETRVYLTLFVAWIIWFIVSYLISLCIQIIDVSLHSTWSHHDGMNVRCY